ncbi:DNA polymerase [Streptomyces sp. MNP-20]|uniref:DNA polymerase n=1 Tax=Streptomyces sp. MNP-20 TaxID=2721165 RepID=UPI001C1E73B4|nr:DNA polymerase [Streptomyces sp. MNP-20]
MHHVVHCLFVFGGKTVLTYHHTVAGDPVRIHVPVTPVELDQFIDWARDADRRGPVALDTETSGLAMFSAGYKLRTVQFGDAQDAWVIHWERGGAFRRAALHVLHRARQFLIHNAPFDWLVLDQHAGISVGELAPRTRDTRVLAMLLDPRQLDEGGVGVALKPLSAHYVDPAAPDTQGDLTAIFRGLGLTKADGFARIDLDHPTYNLYAGLDVLLTARLYPRLTTELERRGVRSELVEYEHEIARMCTLMQRRGLIVDQEYTRTLADRLAEEADRYGTVAARYGVAKVGSGPQVAEALAGMGETLTERTKGGALSTAKDVLLPMADLDRDWQRIGAREPNPLADAVLRAKRAEKWGKTYAEGFLAKLSPAGRIHPTVTALAARTGRMSVADGLHQLPSSDHVIRRAILAEEGHVWISTDFQAVEMRVLAALAGVRRMVDGFRNGGDAFDIHMFTAQLIKGAGATPKDRKLFKSAGFGKVYGGGLRTLSRQTGASESEIHRAVTAYDSAFPEIRRASARWQREARATGLVTVSATGRHMPLDRDRMYAVVNYQCQSAGRDLLGQAMLNAEAAGVLECCRLPIHDELLASAPVSEAQEIAREFEKAMTMDLFGVPIVATADIGGRSWGSLYGADV